MRPVKQTPAHHTEDFAELVCSNSLGNRSLETAPGLLKEELRRLGSVILRCADAHSVPAGGALGVAREDFSRTVTEAVHSHPRIEVVRAEATELPGGPTVVATGPLTSDALVQKIEALSGETLYFYDAASPIIFRDSLDDGVIYRASRYGKGEAAYLNCPMTEDQYYAFVGELATAELSPIKNFEEDMYFEGCLPVETIARRGPESLSAYQIRAPTKYPSPSCSSARTTPGDGSSTSSASRPASSGANNGASSARYPVWRTRTSPAWASCTATRTFLRTGCSKPP
jgi:methylenetetrahydrofolate--tRNA-(uracil-5-)-methyltransferase